MPRFDRVSTNFTKGEFSPRVLGRLDTTDFGDAASEILNFVVQVQGGVMKRPGTRFVIESLSNGAPIRLLPFQVSTEASYVIEMTGGLARFYTDEAVVLDANGQPFTLAVPYTGRDVVELRTTQSADVLYIAHENHPPKELRRLSAAEFEINDHAFRDGPYLDVNTTPTVVKPAAVTGAAIRVEIGAPILGVDIALDIFAVAGDRVKDVDVGDKLVVTGSTGNNGTWTVVVRSYNKTTNRTSIGVSEDVTNATADGKISLSSAGNHFEPTDIQRHLRIKVTANWGWARVSAYVSAGEVDVDIVDVFDGTAVTTNFRFGAWSFTTGWPRVVAIHRNRLTWGGTPTHPDTVWFSEVGIFASYRPSELDGTVVASNAITATLESAQVNRVTGLTSAPQGLFINTSGDEFLITESTTAEGFSSTNIQARKQSSIGSTTLVEPISVGLSLIYPRRGEKAIIESAFDFDFDGFAGRDISTLADHLIKPGIRASSWMRSPIPVIWFVNEDELLIGVTFDRDKNVFAWHKHTLGGITQKEVPAGFSIPFVFGQDTFTTDAFTLAGFGSNQDDSPPIGTGANGAILHRHLARADGTLPDGEVVFFGRQHGVPGANPPPPWRLTTFDPRDRVGTFAITEFTDAGPAPPEPHDVWVFSKTAVSKDGRRLWAMINNFTGQARLATFDRDTNTLTQWRDMETTLNSVPDAVLTLDTWANTQGVIRTVGGGGNFVQKEIVTVAYVPNDPAAPGVRGVWFYDPGVNRVLGQLVPADLGNPVRDVVVDASVTAWVITSNVAPSNSVKLHQVEIPMVWHDTDSPTMIVKREFDLTSFFTDTTSTELQICLARGMVELPSTERGVMAINRGGQDAGVANRGTIKFNSGLVETSYFGTGFTWGQLFDLGFLTVADFVTGTELLGLRHTRDDFKSGPDKNGIVQTTQFSAAPVKVDELDMVNWTQTLGVLTVGDWPSTGDVLGSVALAGGAMSLPTINATMVWNDQHVAILWQGKVTQNVPETRTVTGPGRIAAMTSIPSDTSARMDDQVWIVARRLINGVEKWYIEFLEDFFFEDIPISDMFFVDSGLVGDFSSSSGGLVTSVAGLGHLEGETVAVLADGSPQPQRVVTNGSVTVDPPAGKVIVGLPFTARLGLTPLDNLDPPTVGKMKRAHQVHILLDNAIGAIVDVDGESPTRIEFRRDTDPMNEPLPVRGGLWSETLTSRHTKRPIVAITHDEPLPLTVLAAAVDSEVHGS